MDATNRSRCAIRNLTRLASAGITGIRNSTRGLCANASRRPPKPSPDFPCYECENACIYKLVELLYVIGIIANFLVVSRVIRDRKLRKPTFVAIGCLALCDGLFLSSNIAVAAEIVVRSLTCTMVPNAAFAFQSKALTIIHGVTWFAANLHITLLAVVRYFMVVYPLKSNLYLTNKRILISSVCLWVFAITFFLLKYVIENAMKRSVAKSAEATTVLWLCAYLMPLIVTSVLHLVKLQKLRSFSKIHDKATSVYTSTSVRRMSRVIIVVIVCALILPLPRFIYTILKRTGHDFESRDARQHFLNTAMLLYFLNNAVNPFIYALMSRPFRTSLRAACRCTCARACRAGGGGDYSAMSSPASLRRSETLTGVSAITDSPDIATNRKASVNKHDEVSSI